MTRLTMLATLAFLSSAKGFLHNSRYVVIRRTFSTTAHYATGLPSVEELSTDPFGKQVLHASTLVNLLSQDSTETSKLLEAQLSHSDGIRGFFVTYLTGEGTTAADEEQVPKTLMNAMEKSNLEDLVPLACMNVVMPTAMKTLHTDEALAESSARTAKRGKKILQALKDQNFPKVDENCAAILAAAKGEDSDEELIGYWKQFFDNYWYDKQQLTDICETFEDLCD